MNLNGRLQNAADVGGNFTKSSIDDEGQAATGTPKLLAATEGQGGREAAHSNLDISVVVVTSADQEARGGDAAEKPLALQSEAGLLDPSAPIARSSTDLQMTEGPLSSPSGRAPTAPPKLSAASESKIGTQIAAKGSIMNIDADDPRMHQLVSRALTAGDRPV